MESYFSRREIYKIMNLQMLNKKTAIITGGASGIGRAIAESFVKNGAKVVLVDLNMDMLNDAKRDLADECEIVQVDVTKESDIENAIQTGVKRFGHIDIGINSAGIGTYSMLVDQTEEEWDKIQNINLKGVFLSMKHEARQMIKQDTGGVIINISSINSCQPGEGNSAYCTAKAGVNMLTKTSAMELGQHNIRVCGIAPGLVETPLTDVLKDMPLLKDAYMDNILLDRAGTVDDISNAAVFLASNQASWITGTTMFIDGGAMTKRYPEFSKIFKQMNMES